MSKAADKSKRTNPTAAPLSIEVAMSFCILSKAISVSEKLYMQTDFHWRYPREQCANLSV